MNALLYKSKQEGLKYTANADIPVVKTGEVLIKIKAAALNHRDVWITKGLYPGIKDNVILGSDGVGEYEGKDVLINPNIDWGTSQKYPSTAYSILGMPTNGTFAQFITVAKDRIVLKPSHLTIEEAAALPLAGLTAYRALFSRGKLKKREKVFINGIGGGVALMALQFALAVGAEVYVSSSSDDKISKAISLGAIAGINYKTVDWSEVNKSLANSFDLIIDSAGGEGFKHLLKLAAPGGRIVTYGGTRGVIPAVPPQLVFWKQLSILGTSMGSDQDFTNMLEFVTKNKIKPIIDLVYPLKEGLKAFKRMENGMQFGKIILSVF